MKLLPECIYFLSENKVVVLPTLRIREKIGMVSLKKVEKFKYTILQVEKEECGETNIFRPAYMQFIF